EQTYLNILSPLLVNAIRSVVTYTSENLDGNRIQLSAPYKLLYNHWSELEDYKSNHPVTHDEAYIAECNAHIDFLLRFLEESDGGGIRIEQARWNRDRPTATFKNLWLLLKPGEMVFVRKDDEPSPYVVEWVGGGVIKGKATAYKVEVWNIDYDGQYFGRSLFNVEIKPFDGEVEISRLKIYPEAYHPNLESERERLIARGKKFFKAVKDYSFMEYTGTTVQGPKRKYVRERIVFDYTFQPWLESQLKNKHEPDFSGYFSDSMGASNCFCDACLKAEEAKTCNTMGRYYGWDQMDPTETSFSDQQYLLCSRIVYGYVLKERQWRILDVAGVSVPTFNPGIMDSLVMDENKKDVIKAICHEFTRSETNFTADFVPGKGQGRIFLLHGKPGVGKTLTAECVAENTRRPLLSITAGDIGTTGDRVEANLSRYFKWAEDWKAILLMDEADIYLEERSKRELERNSVVSVFLRALEYYSGILFITTNRVGTFDEAFQSRIHISIHYKGFDEKQRRQVWENNFDKLYKERNGKVSYDYSVREFVLRDKYVQDLDWNGREIRNCFQTAVTLAEYEANREGRDTVQLKKSHLERVMDMSKAFENYL
ncbi:P-loop containing nucleoside triphosphate hydrolase protein, partial [Patellaria atrata CBS 101060]